MENISNDDLKLVIEALLFTSSIQVMSEHNDSDTKKMVDIAKKLNVGKNIIPNGVYYLVEESYEESYAPDILKAFPEIPQVGVKQMLNQQA